MFKSKERPPPQSYLFRVTTISLREVSPEGKILTQRIIGEKQELARGRGVEGSNTKFLFMIIGSLFTIAIMWLMQRAGMITVIFGTPVIPK